MDDGELTTFSHGADFTLLVDCGRCHECGTLLVRDEQFLRDETEFCPTCRRYEKYGSHHGESDESCPDYRMNRIYTLLRLVSEPGASGLIRLHGLSRP